MGKLVRRTVQGDSSVLEWSADDAARCVRRPRRSSVRCKAGYMAVLGGEGGNEPIDNPSPGADVVILTMPMGGG